MEVPKETDSEESQDADADTERKERVKSARRVLRTLGHIDFTTRETGTYPPLIQQGIKEDGTPATAASWIEMYRASYGYSEEFDDPKDKQSEEEFKTAAIAHVHWALGPDSQYSNPKLLVGILKELGQEVVTPASEGESFDNNEDPLIGTKFAGISNEELWMNQTVFGEDGGQYQPSQGIEYRKAFKYYAEITKLL